MHSRGSRCRATPKKIAELPSATHVVTLLQAPIDSTTVGLFAAATRAG